MRKIIYHCLIRKANRFIQNNWWILMWYILRRKIST